MAKRELIFKEDGQGELSCHLAVRQVAIRRKRACLVMVRSGLCKARAGDSFYTGRRRGAVFRGEGVLSAGWARVVEAWERGTCRI
jgi:hypothetical protein